MADGEQFVATIANVSIEVAKLLAKALERIFDELIKRASAEYRLSNLEAKRNLKESKVKWRIEDAVKEGGWVKDYKNLRALENPNDPFVACGFYASEETMSRINNYARREGIPFTGLQTEKDDKGKRTYLLYCRESDMEKIADITELINYDKRIEGIEKAIENEENLMLNHKQELAELEMNNGDSDRIAELHNNISENEEVIKTLIGERDLAVSSREYLLNKMMFGEIVEETRQKLFEEKELAKIDSEIQGCEKEIETLSTINNNLQSQIQEIESYDIITEEDSLKIEELNAQINDNDGKIDALQNKKNELTENKENILQSRTERESNLRANSVSVDKSHAYSLNVSSLSFSEAINRNTNKEIGRNSAFANYYLLDMSNPNQYIECNGANANVDGKKYMKTTYDVYVDGKKVETFNDGRRSGETSSEHNSRWNDMRTSVQENYGFSDNIIHCKNLTELRRYQKQLLQTTEKTQSKVEGFGYEADSKKEGLREDVSLGRDYDSRIEELKNQLSEMGYSYHDGMVWDLKHEGESYTVQDMLSRSNAAARMTEDRVANNEDYRITYDAHYDYLETAITMWQVEAYTELRNIENELAVAETKLYAYSVMPTQQNEVKAQIAQLESDRNSHLEFADTLAEFRATASKAKAANVVCEYNFTNDVYNARKLNIIDKEPSIEQSQYYNSPLLEQLDNGEVEIVKPDFLDLFGEDTLRFKNGETVSIDDFLSDGMQVYRNDYYISDEHDLSNTTEDPRAMMDYATDRIFDEVSTATLVGDYDGLYDIDGMPIPTDEEGFDSRTLEEMAAEAKKGSDIDKQNNADNHITNEHKRKQTHGAYGDS